MGQKHSVEFLHVTRRQLALPLYEVEKPVHRGSVILNHVEDEPRIPVCGRRGNELLAQSVLDQDFGDPLAEGVDAFDQTGLNRPFTFEAFVEFPDCPMGDQFRTILVPIPGELAEFGVRKALPIVRQILDGSPLMANSRRSAGVLGHVHLISLRGTQEVKIILH